MPLLEVTNLKQHFTTKKGFIGNKTIVKAVDGVSITINEGETLGIVGESGCGKSSLGRSILRLVEPTEGSIKFEGKEIVGISAKEMKKLRKEMQIVFQDPYASLNPRRTVQQILEAPFIIHNSGDKKDRKEMVASLAAKVGLRKEQLNNYPHEFSGGQRQRIGIARALTLNPKLIIADEPVSALDVSVQSQVLNLMLELQEERNLSYMFISHDLSVVQHISDKVAVMYLGKIVEIADVTKVYDTPIHPYTRALLSALPVPDPAVVKNRIILKGDLPSPSNPPTGCTFHTRCPMATKECSEIIPPLEEKATGHFAACIHV